jgi:hypothetical protein
MKIKCVKAECPSCKVTGSIQLFLNKAGEVRYARTRHYLHIDKDSKKPQFSYCRLNLEDLEALLKSQGFSMCNRSLGQAIQGPKTEIFNSIQDSASDFLKVKNAGPLGFEPRTFSLEG